MSAKQAAKAAKCSEIVEWYVNTKYTSYARNVYLDDLGSSTTKKWVQIF